MTNTNQPPPEPKMAGSTAVTGSLLRLQNGTMAKLHIYVELKRERDALRTQVEQLKSILKTHGITDVYIIKTV